MGKYLSFLVSVVFYLIGVGGLFYLILWMGNLLPFHPFDSEPTQPLAIALSVNAGLLLLFGTQHSIMARKSFKKIWTTIIPPQLERSFFVVISGLLCFLIAYNWMSVDGVLWSFAKGSIPYYISYTVYFLGIFWLLSASFLINHFELFGLQQGFHHMIGKKKGPQKFVEFAYYKFVRHPIYTGVIMIGLGTPHMSMTHFLLAGGILAYIFVGYRLEEKDLVNEFGEDYEEYRSRIPALVPFTK